jgi:hypothetical protein
LQLGSKALKNQKSGMMSEQFQFGNPFTEVQTELMPEMETMPRHRQYPDFHTEILDVEEGWIYEKKKNGKKGKKIRKFYERLNGYGFGRNDDDSITFWRPKINDLVTCEAKRWKAIQYRIKQYAKIIGVFDLVLKNTPFCCIRTYPNSSRIEDIVKWIVFPHYPQRDSGVSHDLWDGHETDPKTGQRAWNNGRKTQERPNVPLKQDIGDAWFHYEDRSRILRERCGYFEQVFEMALKKRYEEEFCNYENRYSTKKKCLIINGRTYVIGPSERNRFGVLAYPEDLTTEIVE